MAKTNEEGSTGTLLTITMVVGSLLGAAGGLLLAPQPGKQTRDKLRATYDTMSQTVSDFMKKYEGSLPDFFTKVKDELQDVPEQVKTELASIAKDTGETITKVREIGSVYFKDVSKTIATTFDEGKHTLASTLEEGKKLVLGKNHGEDE
ncbi:MAG: YtxH domain-containing protein [Nitrospirae bacterium]|nr:YtxH domain-containing protein [Nitrospirota bacterium]MBF0591044.1 YtxH domain-containing protein [Nitrospirota bacterium]